MQVYISTLIHLSQIVYFVVSCSVHDFHRYIRFRTYDFEVTNIKYVYKSSFVYDVCTLYSLEYEWEAQWAILHRFRNACTCTYFSGEKVRC